LERHLVVISPARFHLWQHSRAKERLTVPKEELDEKRAEYERERKEKRTEVLRGSGLR